MKSEIVKLITETAKELAEQDEFELDSEFTPDSTLFGDNGLLDSMGLVSLVVAVEQAIEEKFDTVVSLADEKALSQKNSPYRTVSSLAEYSEMLIKEEQG